MNKRTVAMRAVFGGAVIALLAIGVAANHSRADTKADQKADVHPRILESLRITRSEYEKQMQLQDNLVAGVGSKKEGASSAGRRIASIPPGPTQHELEKTQQRLTELSFRSQILSEWLRKRYETREQLKQRSAAVESEIRRREQQTDVFNPGSADDLAAEAVHLRLKIESQMIQEMEQAVATGEKL